MTIHTTHPFLEPEGQRDDVRRLRGRVGAHVTLWTAGMAESRAGLTVSSWMVANGETGRLVGLFDPDSELVEEFRDTGRAVVHLLEWHHRDLADVFAGVAPLPGGPWRTGDWRQTDHGPRLGDVGSWAQVAWESEADVGWSTMVTARIDELVLGDEGLPLVHRRGRYVRPTD